MMKFSILLSLIFFSACIPQTEEPAAQTEEFVRFEPLSVPAEDLARIKAICEALELKEQRLPDLVSSDYTFGVSQKGCDEAKPSAEVNVEVTLVRPDFFYLFKLKDGSSFLFPNVETSAHGVMSPICANLGNLNSPLQTSSKGAIWFTTFTSTRHCTSDFDSMCIHIQKGDYVSDINYKIHTNEWIKFKIKNDKVGFYLERKFVSQADCPAGKTREKKVRLKN
jgi:hypothetical protein